MVILLKQFAKLTFTTCIEKGLLEQVLPSQQKAERSIAYAEGILEEARATLAHKHLHATIALAYQAAFHAARALLEADGWREKSHACVARYLEEKHVKAGRLEQAIPALLDRMRDIRHSNQYNTDFIATEAEAAQMVKSAANIIAAIKKVIKKA